MFTRFETVTSSCVTSLTDRPVASARRATRGIQKHSEPALLKLHQIKHTINRESQRSSVAMCLFVPWPQEQVVVQLGCSHLVELGLFHVTSSDHQSLFLLLVLLTLFCMPLVIFSLLSTDITNPEDFDNLCVP